MARLKNYYLNGRYSVTEVNNQIQLDIIIDADEENQLEMN